MLAEEPLPVHFRLFAATVERDGGSTYAAISRGIADDPMVLSLLDGAPPSQRRPVLLLAAVHSLLLAGSGHPLAAYYDTVAAVRAVPFEPPAGTDVATVFTDFCAMHRAEIERLVATRSTQTNEVGRCTALLPGLCHIAAQYGWTEPLSLLDLGTSAGLNLLFDDYAYTYVDAEGGAALTAGAAGAAVGLSCTARPDHRNLPDLRLPRMAERVGLDLSPLDPFSDDEARWLEACQWPDNLVRFARLRAALSNARTAAHKPRLARGDILTDVSAVAATIAADHPLVVFHSWVAAYLRESEQRALVEQIAALATTRPVHYLYCESPFETPGLPTPSSPVRREGPDLATALVHIGPGAASAVRLADTHPHGSWIRWWPEPDSTP